MAKKPMLPKRPQPAPKDIPLAKQRDKIDPRGTLKKIAGKGK